ncbi:YcaO-like family protein [Finegoldia magna]|uniref:YcaO-like family protein n=1 Tax=Finegoldia magna TaxID=1260 RepID=UPI00290EAB0E|nr:YcaO-like family protein [Finegoldia magna]MDU5508184.1 YcaO-like family protein [Finegoldia magna]
MSNEEYDRELLRTLDSAKCIFGEKYGLANKKYVAKLSKLTLGDENNSFEFGNIIPMYKTKVSNTNNKIWDGGGCSLDKTRSEMKAYGEFIERYCGDYFLDKNDFIFESYSNLKKNKKCLSLKELIHFEENAYYNNTIRYHKYNDELPISWVEGVDIVKDESIFIPAQKVFLRIKLKPTEKLYLQWLSTGLACGSSFEMALLGGIFEVVERDSFMLTWQLCLPGKKIIIDKIRNKNLKKIFNHITKNINGNDQLYIYDISRTEGIYTVCTFIKNNSKNSFGLIVSAASDIDIEKALIKSLEELCMTQSFAYEKWFNLKNEKKQQILIEDVENLHNHTLYYGSGERSDIINFISKTKETILLSSMKCFCEGNDKDKLNYIKELFRKMNRSIYAVDVTKKEIKNLGFRVVKSIISDYNDLEVSHSCRLTNNKRLLKYKEDYKKQINDEPHPFP